MGDVDTELSLADQMLAVSEVDEDVSGCPLKSVFDPDHLEQFPSFCLGSRFHFGQQLHNFLTGVSGGLAPQEVIDK